MKRVGFLVVLFCFLMTATVYAQSLNLQLIYDGKIHEYRNRKLDIFINDKLVDMKEMPAVIIDDKTLVPAREVFESEGINAKVEWNEVKQEVYITYKDIFVRLKINDKTAYVNNQKVVLEVPAKLIQDTNQKSAKTMIPIRFVSEALQYTVEWVDKENRINLYAKDYQIIENPDDNSGTTPIEEVVNRNLLNWNLHNDFDLNKYQSYVNKSPIEGISEATVFSITKDTNQYTYRIKADREISDFEVLSLDNNRLVVDIKNSKWALPSSTKFNQDNLVSQVRTSQTDLYEVNTTRIVFDLSKALVQSTVTLSDDRKEVIVDFNNLLLGLKANQDKDGDTLELQGLFGPAVKVSTLENPNRIVIDMPNTISGIIDNEQGNLQGRYIDKIRLAEKEDSSTRVVLEINKNANYIITEHDNKTVVQITDKKEVVHKNLTYDLNTNTISLKLPKAYQLQELTEDDLYMERKYKIILPGDQRSFYNSNYMINEGDLLDVNVSLNGQGNTELVISTTVVKGYQLSVNGDTLSIRMMHPTERYSQIVVIDAGHGGKDPGATNPSYGLAEKSLNLDVVLHLKALLDSHDNIKVYYIRLTDVYYELYQRVGFANEVKADLFISIHHNSFTTPRPNGTLAMYTSNEDLALTNVPITNVKLATILKDELVKELKLADSGLQKKPMQNGSIHVLKNSKVPTTLLEIGFLSNPDDAMQIKNPEFQVRSARAIYRGIINILRDYPVIR